MLKLSTDTSSVQAGEMTLTLDEAKKLRDQVSETGLLFCLMHNYSAYPMVRQARLFCTGGELGTIRKIVAQYDLGWLAAPNAGKQALWRCDMSRDSRSPTSAPTSRPLSRDVNWMTMVPYCCASTAVPVVSSRPARSPAARRTSSRSVSTARPAPSNGARWSRRI